MPLGFLFLGVFRYSFLFHLVQWCTFRRIHCEFQHLTVRQRRSSRLLQSESNPEITT